ncbi:MAG: hypothetical protein OXM62_03185 [bacterium]|nr:hypothetical protein [bacterium]MDE0233990.1 hypothetical protein [bacterium]
MLVMAIAWNVEDGMDGLVVEMLDKGPGEVPRPPGIPPDEFGELQEIIGAVVRMYHPVEQSVPWRLNPYPSSKHTLMDHINNRDYEAARDLLLACGCPPLA